MNSEQLGAVLARQRAAFERDGILGAPQRRANLAKLKRAMNARRADLEAAVRADFVYRSAYETAMLELAPTVGGIDYLRRNLARWMRPHRRRVGLHLRPGVAEILYQPLGVVGVISPWNYPIGLCLMPLATALAAGNRVMLKPSELTPRTADAIAAMLSEIFSEGEVFVATGGPEVGAAFSELPFDHLIFTGSTRVGRFVMKAASDHLVPVTLELGGKSPAIIDRGYALERAAASVAFGKLVNAGQTCIAPDYALVPSAQVDAFAAAYERAARAYYPAGERDDAYAAIISRQHYDRLRALLDDARAKGARIVEVGATTTPRENTVVPTLLLDATADMQVMQEEIFGPILPVVAYDAIDDAIAYVNARPRPLALYVFSDRRDAVDQVLTRTISGNVTVNDTLLHYAVEDLPFGGVGPSGMGAYHGEEGFRQFSHAKGVFIQSRWNLAGVLRPPYRKLTDAVLSYLLK
jgi:coniferyl-aldehyde dehydrogenase